MAHIADNSHQNQLLLIALLCSIALHGTAVVFLPDYFAHAPAPDTPLTVELLAPKPPPPPPQPIKEPEPPKPEPVKPKVIPPSKPQQVAPPKPVAPPQPQPVAQPAAPTPVQAPPPVAEQPPMVAVPQKAAEPPPTFTAPAPPAPPPPQETGTEDISAIKNSYGRLLAGEFAKHKKYPQVARMRGWQGTVQVRLQVDAEGNSSSPAIEQSSGRELLDNQALETVRNSLPLPPPPPALRGKPFSIVVPVVFRLD